MNRLDAKCYNRKTLEALIKGGAFDSTGYTRKQLMYFVEETPLLEGASKRQKDRDRGQVSMFDLFATIPIRVSRKRCPHRTAWSGRSAEC